MNRSPAKCTNCGSYISAHNNQDYTKCPYCEAISATQEMLNAFSIEYRSVAGKDSTEEKLTFISDAVKRIEEQLESLSDKAVSPVSYEPSETQKDNSNRNNEATDETVDTEHQETLIETSTVANIQIDFPCVSESEQDASDEPETQDEETEYTDDEDLFYDEDKYDPLDPYERYWMTASEEMIQRHNDELKKRGIDKMTSLSGFYFTLPTKTQRQVIQDIISSDSDERKSMVELGFSSTPDGSDIFTEADLYRGLGDNVIIFKNLPHNKLSIENHGIDEMLLEYYKKTEDYERSFSESNYNSITDLSPETLKKITTFRWNEPDDKKLTAIRISADDISRLTPELCEILKDSTISYIRFDKDVTEIPPDVFRGWSRLEYVYLPESVTYINGFAFNNCTSLKMLVLPKGLKNIGKLAFGGCTSLKNVVCFTNISLGINCFEGCTALESFISLDSSLSENDIKEMSDHYDKHPGSDEKLAQIIEHTRVLENIEDINKFRQEHLELFDCGWNDGGWFELPEELQCRPKINQGAFKGCSSLLYADIPVGTVSIEKDSFNGCASLEAVTIPQSVRLIDAAAFAGCKDVEPYFYTIFPEDDDETEMEE